MIGDELATAWNQTNTRQIEPGPGFGSQFIEGTVECEGPLLSQVDPAVAHRILAFDWWVRNRDRIVKNPNLLWSHSEAHPYVIDHDQAGQTDGVEAFWQDHLFAPRSDPWMPPGLLGEMRTALTQWPVIVAELPSAWTNRTEGLSWFFKQLDQSTATTPNPDWRNYE